MASAGGIVMGGIVLGGVVQGGRLISGGCVGLGLGWGVVLGCCATVACCWAGLCCCCGPGPQAPCLCLDLGNPSRRPPRAGHRPQAQQTATQANTRGATAQGTAAQGTAAQGQKPRAMATRQSPAGPAKGNHRPHSPYILVGGACVLPAVYTPGAWPVLTPWGNSPKHSPPQAPKQAHRPRAGQCLAQGRPQASRQAQAAAAGLSRPRASRAGAKQAQGTAAQGRPSRGQSKSPSKP